MTNHNSREGLLATFEKVQSRWARRRAKAVRSTKTESMLEVAVKCSRVLERLE